MAKTNPTATKCPKCGHEPKQESDSNVRRCAICGQWWDDGSTGNPVQLPKPGYDHLHDGADSERIW